MTLAPLLVQAAPTELVEQSVWLPIRVNTPEAPNQTIRMAVRMTYPAGATGLPFAFLLHGRPSQPADFRRMGIHAYPANARWLAHLGFLVLVPTRIGYGQTAGADLEYAGPCNRKDYGPPLAAMWDQLEQVLHQWPALALREHLPALDSTQGVVLGESFGALGALALADGRLPGVRAVINIAGGDGGDVLRHPDRPCAAQAVAGLMEQLGAQAVLPSLWLYSVNDHLWGSSWPREWFRHYQQAGGDGHFVALPATPDNGHFVFNQRPLFWQPPVQGFLQEHIPALRPAQPNAARMPSAASGPGLTGK